MTVKRSGGGLMERIAAFIVDKRNLFFLLYAIAAVFSVVAMGWVNVENDVTKYLPEETETRQGIDIMAEHFEAFATGRVMVTSVTYETAAELADAMAAVDGVDMVTFDATDAHYRDASALYDISFSGGIGDESAVRAVEEIRALVADHDYYIDTAVGQDMVAMLHGEMLVILIVAAAIVLLVLTLTSRAYMEVPVLIFTFGMAALLNMGTNFIFGTISFISDSVAVVLQLALAVDYAIILCHRFSDEHELLPAREACVAALSKSLPEIGASSLTTVGGLVALSFMKFTLGFDMSVVLIKSILLSMLSVFTFMPGLLMVFCPLIDKTRHKKLLPRIDFLGKFAVKVRRVLPPLFVLVIIGAFVLSGRCPYCYNFTDLKTAKMTEQQTSYFAIKEVFGTSNMVALVVPSGDYEAEAAIMEELSQRPEVKSTMGLASVEIMDGYGITDALTPRELSELVDMDYEVVQVLYSAYASQNNEYGEILGGLENYRVPLFDMAVFLKDQLDERNIYPESLGQEDMGELLDMLDMARGQLRSDRYSRMVVYLNLAEESEETFAFLDEMRAVMGRYYDGDYYVVGNSTSSRDLADYFAEDNLMISILSALFVILVLLFTFRSVGLPVLLIIVIQGSIWINFSVPTFTGQPLYFLGYLIVNAIMMGANIDYAIVISSHYQEQKQYMSHKEAIVHALNASYTTVLTSGSMLASAGLLIGNLSAQPVIAIMGTCLGRGTIISVVLVLFVLPSILVLGDSIIERTSFRIKSPLRKQVETAGTVRVRGHVRGYVSGMVDGEFNGTIRGRLEASVSAGGEVEKEGGERHD